MSHLMYGSGTCLLNIILHFPIFIEYDHRNVKNENGATMNQRISDGSSKRQTGIAPIRAFGPLRRIVGVDGLELDATVDNRHPFGPQKRKFVRPSFPGCECWECIPP